MCTTVKLETPAPIPWTNRLSVFTHMLLPGGFWSTDLVLCLPISVVDPLSANGGVIRSSGDTGLDSEVFVASITHISGNFTTASDLRGSAEA